MAKIRKKKLKNKRLRDFFAALKGSARNGPGGQGLTGSRCTAAAYRTGWDGA